MSSGTDRFRGITSDSGSIAVLMTMCVALMVSMFNASMIGVLLPGIADSTSASPTDLQWVATIYMLALAASLMPGSAIGKRYGRRLALLAGLLLFLAGAFLCAVAEKLSWLLFGRLVQAVGVGIYMPQTLAILVVEYSDLKRRARAIGVWSGVASIGLVVGPLVGGIAVMLVSWRAGFFLSVVLCFCALISAWRWLSKERHGRPSSANSFDLLGTLFSVLWLSCLVLAVNESSRQGWGSDVVVQALIVAVAGLMCFLVTENWKADRGIEVLMPLGIWCNRRFVMANIGGAAFFMSLFGILFFYPIFFYVELGYHSVAVGAAFIPMTLMMALSASVGGRLMARVGIFKVFILGAVCASLSLSLLSIATYYKSEVLVELLLASVGVGFGLLSASTSNGAVSSVAPLMSGLASGVHTTCRQVGSALGISLLGVFVHGEGKSMGAGYFAEGLATAMQFSAAVVFSIAILTWQLLRER
ncbi:MFS transporter [Pseudomonas sp. WHRI 8519]|uniref:MFS transporter n=1 Tax=Pseudomonas sp. WHRI 8519 TaxID=3162567 RepID=UPI0032EBAF4A